MSRPESSRRSVTVPIEAGVLSLHRRRVLLSVAIAAGGTILSLLLFGLLRDQEEQIAAAQFRASAERRIQAIQSAILDRLGTIGTLVTYYAGSALVERSEFDTFVNGAGVKESLLKNRPDIKSLGWAPRIRDAQRRAHVQFVRDDGIRKYDIVEMNDRGQFVRAGTRDEYFPLLFIQPSAEDQIPFGYDIRSDARYSAAMNRAATSGQPAAGTCPRRGNGSGARVLLYALAQARNSDFDPTERPADQPAADGFVFGLFDAGAVVESSLRSTTPVGIDIEVAGPSGAGGETVIYLRPSPLRVGEGASAADRPMRDVSYSGEIRVADLHWKVNCVPLRSYWEGHLTWGPLTALLAGLLITGLLVGYTFLLTGRTARVERLVAEKTRELQESEQRFRRLVDNAGDGFFLHTDDGKILDVNRGACESLGYTREELLTMTLADIDADYVSHDLEQQAKRPPDEYPRSFEGVHRRKDGTTFPVEIRLNLLIAGEPRIMLGLARDISERARMQRTLREGELKFAAILDQTFQFIGLMAPDGTLLESNKSALAFSGVSLDEVRNKPFWETPWWSHSAELQQELREAVKRAAQGDFVRTEVTHLAANGELHWIDFSLKPVKDETGKVAFLIPEGRDITARKRMEEALNKEQQLLRNLLDLQEQDRKLVAYEIHDGLAQQLAGSLYKFQAIEGLGNRDPDAARELFDEAVSVLREAMAEARRLISGLRPPILDEAGVVDAIDYMIAEQRRPDGPEIEFVHPETFERLAPPLESAVFRIVQECLTNACRYSKSPKVRVELQQIGGRAQVEVRDWGVGFDPANVDHGHYGLQGIRERARLLGGSALIDTAAGRGTCVTVYLPMLPPKENGLPKKGMELRMDAE